MITPFFTRTKLLLLIGLLACVALPVSSALAQEQTPPERLIERLETQYQRMLEISAKATDRLERANEVADTVDNWISERQAEGKDTSAVETAQADFRAAIAYAEASKATADAFLAEHAGFDDSGQVIDPQVAAETLRSVRSAYIDGHLTLRDAAIDLRQAIRDFREENVDS